MKFPTKLLVLSELLTYPITLPLLIQNTCAKCRVHQEHRSIEYLRYHLFAAI